MLAVIDVRTYSASQLANGEDYANLLCVLIFTWHIHLSFFCQVFFFNILSFSLLFRIEGESLRVVNVRYVRIVFLLSCHHAYRLQSSLAWLFPALIHIILNDLWSHDCHLMRVSIYLFGVSLVLFRALSLREQCAFDSLIDPRWILAQISLFHTTSQQTLTLQSWQLL